MLINRYKPRTRKAMFSYLYTHYTKDGLFCQNVKFGAVLIVDDNTGNLREPTAEEIETAGKFFDAIDGTWSLSDIQIVLDRFAEEYKGYSISTAGRSGGYMVLNGMDTNQSWNLMTTADLKAALDVVWAFDMACLDATTAFLENAKAWAEGTKKDREKAEAEAAALADWTSEPAFCPYCGGKEIKAVGGKPVVIYGNAYKCISCNGRSFLA